MTIIELEKILLHLRLHFESDCCLSPNLPHKEKAYRNNLWYTFHPMYVNIAYQVSFSWVDFIFFGINFALSYEILLQAGSLS